MKLWLLVVLLKILEQIHQLYDRGENVQIKRNLNGNLKVHEEKRNMNVR